MKTDLRLALASEGDDVAQMELTDKEVPYV